MLAECFNANVRDPALFQGRTTRSVTYILSTNRPGVDSTICSYLSAFSSIMWWKHFVFV